MLCRFHLRRMPITPTFSSAEVSSSVLGHGDFRYRRVPAWGGREDAAPAKNGHGVVIDREGHIIFLTDHPEHQVIVRDRRGKLLQKWGRGLVGAHGLSIVNEGNREVLFITDTALHCVVKATLDGEILQRWDLPANAGKYGSAAEYLPSWTVHHPNGDFYVLDGYGKDFILHYAADGTYRGIFGGQEGGIAHWGPHGGLMDCRSADEPTLLLAMSDRQHLLQVSLAGTIAARVDLPGGNPRQIRRHGKHFYCAHLADNWPADFNSRGFVSVLDDNLRVVSNLGGTEPRYDEQGKLQPMAHVGETFLHPHDVAIDDEGNVYVAQFNSGTDVLLKLERV